MAFFFGYCGEEEEEGEGGDVEVLYLVLLYALYI